MNRRDALQALTTLAASTGISVQPATTSDLQGIQLVLLKVKGRLSLDSAERLRAHWGDCCKGTALEGVRCIVLNDDIDVEFVRTK